MTNGAPVGSSIAPLRTADNKDGNRTSLALLARPAYRQSGRAAWSDVGRTSASICAFHAAEAQHAVDPLAGQGAGSPSAEVVAIHAAHGSFILRNSIRAREFAECARPFATIGRGDPLARLAAGSCGRRI